MVSVGSLRNELEVRFWLKMKKNGSFVKMEVRYFKKKQKWKSGEVRILPKKLKFNLTKKRWDVRWLGL